MAGQVPRGSRGHGRSSRPGSSLPRGAASGAVRGLVPTPPPVTGKSIPSAPSMPATRSVYRLLLLKGMTPPEASALTAFMCGLPTNDLNWSIKQVNELLFLRRMRQLGRFGDDDGGSRRTH
jgi:hypothetical protein